MGGPPYHTPEVCAGHNCPYHNPSDHRMVDWPKNFRYDRFSYGLVERLCPHGIGHPDPDSVGWLESLDVERQRQGTWGVHGCDGCCGPLGP